MALEQHRSELPPAIQALLALCVAFLLAYISSHILHYFVGISLPALPFALVHGAFAACFAYIRRMAVWWPPILLGFPVAVMLVSDLHVPSIVFLFGFLFLLLLFWSTFRSQVPFYPSGLPVWRAVAELLPAEKSIRFVDIGSGLGGAVLHLSKQRSDSQFIGVELAPLPWLISWLRAWNSRSQGRFIRGDYMQLNFADYDVVFAYLSPAVMTALWRKARMEMRPGSLLLSYEFNISDVQSEIVVQPQEKGAVLYGWRM